MIAKDEKCDARLREAAIEARKLEERVSELKFWKEQHANRYRELEKVHEGVKAKLNHVINGNINKTRSVASTCYDVEARMQLTTALQEAASDATNMVTSNECFEDLVATTDKRVAALQRHLNEAQAELARMEAEVCASKRAVMARDIEVRRLNSLLDGGQLDLDSLVHKAEIQAKNDRIIILMKQVESLTLQNAETVSPYHAESFEEQNGVGTSPVKEAKTDNATFDGQNIDQSAVHSSKVVEGQLADTNYSQLLITSQNETEELRRELSRIQVERDNAISLSMQLKEATGAAAAAVAQHTGFTDDVVRNAVATAHVSDHHNDELLECIVNAVEARDAAESRAAEANAQANRAKLLLAEAVTEMQRLRNFAEQCEEQRDEIISAARSAEEAVERYRAESGLQQSTLESLKGRAYSAEAEQRRLDGLLREASDEVKFLRKQSHAATTAKNEALEVAAAADDERSCADVSMGALRHELSIARERGQELEVHARDAGEAEVRARAIAAEAVAEAESALMASETRVSRMPGAFHSSRVVKQLTDELERVRVALGVALDDAAAAQARLSSVVSTSAVSAKRATVLEQELEAEREARVHAETCLDAAENAVTAARTVAENYELDVARRVRELQVATAERDDARADASAALSALQEVRDRARADADAASELRRDAEICKREVEQLKTLVAGLNNTRDDLVQRLQLARKHARKAAEKMIKAETGAAAERSKAEEEAINSARTKNIVRTLDRERDRLQSELDIMIEDLRVVRARAICESEAAEEARQVAAAAETRGLAAAAAAAAAERRGIDTEQHLERARQIEHELRVENDTLREELRAVADDLASMTREQQLVNSELLKCSGERDELLASLEKTKAKASKADAAARASRKEVNEVVAAYQDLGAENMRLQTAALALERDGQRARLALDANETALATAKTRVRVLEGENRQYITDLQAFELQNDGLTRSLAEAGRAGDGATHETVALREQLSAAQALVTELERAREHSHRELAAADASLHVARARLADAQGERETTSHRLRLEANRVRELEGLLAATRSREHNVELASSEAAQRIQTLQERARMLEEQNHALHRRMHDMQMQREAADADASRLRAVAGTEHRGSTLVGDKATESPTEAAKLRARLGELDRSYAEQTIHITTLTEENAKLRLQLDDASAAASSALAQASMARRELAAATHRETILAARAEDAAESAETSRRALEQTIISSKGSDHDLPVADVGGSGARVAAKDRLQEVERRAVALENELRLVTQERQAHTSDETKFLRAENSRLIALLSASEGGDAALESDRLRAALEAAQEKYAAVEADFQALMNSVEGLKRNAELGDDTDVVRGSVGDSAELKLRLSKLERENASLRSNLIGTEEACEGMQKELRRIQQEYNDLAKTLTGTLGEGADV